MEREWTVTQAPVSVRVHMQARIAHLMQPPGHLTNRPTDPFPRRNDAGLAGAELALAVERHVLATGSVDTVGTTGTFEIAPGAINSVPREARLAIGA